MEDDNSHNTEPEAGTETLETLHAPSFERDPALTSAPWDYIFAALSRIFVWSIILGVLYLLRSFFLLVFLTFVFSYIQGNGVRKLKRWVPKRSVRVVLVASVFLGVLTSIGIFLVPQVKEQAEFFVSRYSEYIESIDRELVRLVKAYPQTKNLLPTLDASNFELDDNGLLVGWTLSESPTGHILQALVGVGAGKGIEENVLETLSTLRDVGGRLFAIGSAFLLSLLFSFLIVLDFPSLSRGVRSLRDTKLRFIYDEVGDNLKSFGTELGKALEAQLFIALLNTLLTALGIYLLGLGDKVAFLSVIVFLCSFVPVVGVFLSSAPICVLALQQGGVNVMLLAVLLIILIHTVETYILNPRIYGHHLHLNPVVVLIILTIAGKLFHVWGLVLGVPICTYIFGHAIQHKIHETSTVGKSAASD